MFLNDEIVVRLKTSADWQRVNLTSPVGLRLVARLSEADNICVFRLADPKQSNPFKVCNALRASADVVWAEPNFSQEVDLTVIPNDGLFSSQWHLRNTGQSGGTSDADVDADDAWDGSQGYGSPGIRIAIIDNGVQTDHPDLSANIVQGYDFFSGDADPRPDGPYDNHGTPVAGLAAAAVNNNQLGVAGVAGKAQILPVRLLHSDSSGDYIRDAATIYRALLYAADNADIINCSWGSLATNSTINAAFYYASTSGRYGRGCPVFCSSGNRASGWATYKLTGIPADTYTFDWVYLKNASGSDGDDTVWLDSVVFPGDVTERFEGTTLPTGWTTRPGSAASWVSVQDGVNGNHAQVAWNGEGSRSVRAGTIGNSQVSGLRVTRAVASGDLTFRVWVSSQAGADGWVLYVDNIPYLSGSGVPAVTNEVTYPATLSAVYGVGATSDFDYRSDFSQHGATLDFVAPGGGGSGGIVTTDRTGSDGYADPDDYDTEFGGTSASSPIAAGIAALVLAKNGNQTRATVGDKLIQYCDKVGLLAYTGNPTRNDNYGYGRLNAYASVNATTADTARPTFTSATVTHYQAVDVVFSEPMGDGVLTPGNYTMTAGRGSLTEHPAKVLRILPTAYRLIWTGGEMAPSGTVTIVAASTIKDVAGNLVTGTLSKNSTGTKRVIAINCGSPYGNQGMGTYYAPQFISDNGFQGNEAYPVLTFTSEMNANYWFDSSVDLSGVVNPAPTPVYQTSRVIYYDYYNQVITYAIPVPAGSYTLRLHFCQNYWNYVGDERFDIYVNGSAQWYMFDILAQTGGQKHKAYIAERTSVSPVNGYITVTLDPRTGNYGDNVSICGIEIVKP